MHPPTPLIELWSRHRGLAAVGALNMVAAAVCLLLMQVDDTTVLGMVEPLLDAFQVAAQKR